MATVWGFNYFYTEQIMTSNGTEVQEAVIEARTIFPQLYPEWNETELGVWLTPDNELTLGTASEDSSDYDLFIRMKPAETIRLAQILLGAAEEALTDSLQETTRALSALRAMSKGGDA